MIRNDAPAPHFIALPRVHRCLRRCVLLAGFVLPLGSPSAAERWEYLGDVTATTARPGGRLSVNLDSLRKRSGHFEVWERIEFAPGTAHRSGDGVLEATMHLTLWALRCRFGEMAKVTEGGPGAFEPRARVLRFYLPLPGGADAAVIEAACGEARRIASERRAAMPEAAVNEVPPAGRGLEAPPTLPNFDEFGEGEE
jgi:hypothetical protein